MDKRKVKWSEERKERWLASRWGGKGQENNEDSPLAPPRGGEEHITQPHPY